VSKAGVFGLTQRMAVELGPHNVTVNAILPGAIESGITATTQEVLGERFPGGEQPRASADALRSMVPAGRRGSSEEVAAAAVFLASDAASYVNGVMLPVDGGWLAT
jgi:NAD(P)-dependent dehydrogenase (short-subunit alcohol dehydrogenase family)